jgi:EpsI family protein
MNTTQKQVNYFYLLLIVMIIASICAMQLRPTHRIADDGKKIDLETMIPRQFGEWHIETQSSGQIINPEVKQRLDQLYSQTLSRTYVNDKGDFIMLSIAYGADQSDAKQLHYPEVCYPSQGFQIKFAEPSVVSTEYGDIKVKHLFAVMGPRSEPITYWTTVGNKVVMAGREAKLEQLKYGFKGDIPDGLLFRVSSITQDTKEGYELQQKFINKLIASLSSESRLRLAGISN